MVLQERPIDYLITGHVTLDQPGDRLGGSSSYAGLTARAIGKEVGLFTAASSAVNLDPLAQLQVHRQASETTSTFHNVYTPAGRTQHLTTVAEQLRVDLLPSPWLTVSIHHCAPVANEVDRVFLEKVACEWLCLTPQGWLRTWDTKGLVSLRSWERLLPLLSPRSIVVLSLEDLGGNLKGAEGLSAICHLLVVTMGAGGALIYDRGESQHLPAPQVREIDSTGCGDIFAAAFFCRLSDGDDAWTAASIANQLAARAATRTGLASIPTAEEISDALLLRLL